MIMRRKGATASTPALPALVVGERRPLMAALVTVSILHAALAVLTALLVGRLVGATPGTVTATAGWTLVAVLGMGLTRYLERVVSERLGQSYVHDLRGLLATGALTDDGRGPSLGVTIARATNDLASVRSWVAQGIAPLVAGGPLILGTVLLLGTLHWTLALAAAVPLLALGITLWVASRTAYRRARTLRRRRGRLAARLTDTLQAKHAVRAAGGEQRELDRIGSDSRRVVEAAVARARMAGVMQAAAMTTAAGIAVLVVLAGRIASVDPAAVATSLTIAGVLASPLAETGRIAEFRQNFRAARRIIAPQLAGVARSGAGTARPPRQTTAGRGTVQIAGLPLPQGRGTLAARSGDRIRLTAPDTAITEQLLHRIAAPRPDDELIVVVDGWDLADLGARRRRELVGLASGADPLERGTLARAARYRRPDLAPTAAAEMLERVGLTPVVESLPRGERTELRRGGQPLGPADVARLHLARAMLASPPLLLLDRIDSALDAEGIERLRRLVEDYPGVVLFTSEAPERVTDRFRTCEVA